MSFMKLIKFESTKFYKGRHSRKIDLITIITVIFILFFSSASRGALHLAGGPGPLVPTRRYEAVYRLVQKK